MSDDDHLFQKLVLEAVQTCGDDMERIQAHVESRMGAMSEDQRERYRRDIHRIIGFREPPGPPYKDN